MSETSSPDSVPGVQSPQGFGWLLTFAVLALLGCDDDDGGKGNGVDEGTGVELQAAATEEALESMLSLKAEEWEWSAGFVRTPSSGSEVPSDMPVTFTWTTDLVHEDENALSEPALAGVAFLLQFSTPLRDPLARVFTTANEYTPSDKLWQAFATSGETITLHVNTADFSANQVVKNGGPFSGLGATFTIVDAGTP